MDKNLKIDQKAILDNSSELECPSQDCDSTVFFPTMKIRKVSALMTGTGQPGMIPQAGPMLCVKCHRELVDTDFGYKDKDEDQPDLTSPKEDNEESAG